MPHPKLVEREVQIPGLDPAHDGVRIAHITDLHCGRLTPSHHVRAAVQLVNDLAPDLVAMTGDYVSWAESEILVMEELLGEIQVGPVFATLGNHDYFTSGRGVASALDRCGHTVLKNQHKTLALNDRPLHVIGVDDPVTRKADFDASFADVPDGGTRLVLCHCPESVDKVASRGPSLMLSGHTHGGQINVRGITERIFMRSGKRYFRAGQYRVDDTTLYVNPGVGYSGVPVRAGQGTRAEVALIVLRPANPAVE